MPTPTAQQSRASGKHRTHRPKLSTCWPSLQRTAIIKRLRVHYANNLWIKVFTCIATAMVLTSSTTSLNACQLSSWKEMKLVRQINVKLKLKHAKGLNKLSILRPLPSGPQGVWSTVGRRRAHCNCKRCSSLQNKNQRKEARTLRLVTLYSHHH